MKDTHDVGPSALIRSSGGPEKNIQKFYSTTYSRAHKCASQSRETKIQKVTLESSKAKLPSTFMKRKTGYTSNLNSYVTYDRSVDEKYYSIGMDAYVSSTAYSHKPPPLPIKAQKAIEKVVPANYDSGFTHLPNTKKGVRFSDGDFTSLMSSSYTPNAWKLKNSSHDKAKIVSSSSAFVTDRGQINSLGSFNTFSNQKSLSAALEKSEIFPKKTFQLKDDGFSRSVRPSILSGGYNLEQFIGNLDKKSVEKIKKLDYPTLVHMLDPNSTQSTSHIVHHLLSPVKDTLEMQKSGIIIGNKEVSGSVKDTPVKLPVIEANLKDRFTSETSNRFAYPAFKFDMNGVDCRLIRNSAFGRNFAYSYTKPAKSAEEIYASLHPSVAKGRWVQENGLHTAQPTRTPYTLVID